MPMPWSHGRDSFPERRLRGKTDEGGSDAVWRTLALLPVPMSPAPRFVKCPQCDTPVPWTPESKWRPFCSERCKTIDLGAWASERYRVETSEAPESGDPAPPRRDEP
jgi:uncharacterized protein